jgi:NAD+ kinase
MSDERHILVIAHTGRTDSLEAGIQVCRQLSDAGLTPVISADEVADMMGAAPDLKVVVLGEDVASHELELVIVLGGDGTILRAAEIARGCDAPLLGVNLGHVGFLAEAEREDLPATVARALARDYDIEERMTISVRVKVDEQVVHESWALNEASVEKASRERSLEVVVEVDGRPLSTFGCDGVVMSTPTGSTAYSFSAGGPVVWPSVDALLMVPLSAHALFARPLVVGPDSSLAVELLERSVGAGVLWCDGRRTFDLPSGARVVVRRSPVPVRLARLNPRPFTDRLVNKFRLPVTGWRGPGELGPGEEAVRP